MRGDLNINEQERMFLLRVLADVLDEVAFFSIGEMTTITGWSADEVGDLSASLNAGRVTLSPSEQRFIGQSLYAWSVSVRKGRIQATDQEVEIGDELDRRRREVRRGQG